VDVWDWVWQWAAAVLAPVADPDAAKADRSSFIDPNG
jgi:hypothetical protein